MAIMDDLYLETRDKLEKANRRIDKLAEALSWLLEDANDPKCRGHADDVLAEYGKDQEEECEHLYAFNDLLGKCVKCGEQFKFISVIVPKGSDNDTKRTSV